jgi:hypothetical protein
MVQLQQPNKTPKLNILYRLYTLRKIVEKKRKNSHPNQSISSPQTNLPKKGSFKFKTIFLKSISKIGKFSQFYFPHCVNQSKSFKVNSFSKSFQTLNEKQISIELEFK